MRAASSLPRAGRATAAGCSLGRQRWNTELLHHHFPPQASPCHPGPCAIHTFQLPLLCPSSTVVPVTFTNSLSLSTLPSLRSQRDAFSHSIKIACARRCQRKLPGQQRAGRRGDRLLHAHTTPCPSMELSDQSPTTQTPLASFTSILLCRCIAVCSVSAWQDPNSGGQQQGDAALSMFSPELCVFPPLFWETVG